MPSEQDIKNVKVSFKGVSIANNVRKFIQGWRTVNTGAKTGMTTAQASSAMSGAVASVAQVAVQQSGMDKDASIAASFAIQVAYLMAMAVGLAATGIGAIAGAALSLIATVYKASQSTPSTVMWEGQVNVSFNEGFPYKFDVSVSTIRKVTISDISNKVEKQLRKNVTSKLNKALSELKKRDVDFVLKYTKRPKAEYRIKIGPLDIDDDVNKKFSKKLAEELEKVQNNLKETAVEIANLHFLAAMNAKDLVHKEAVRQVPQVKYKAEGAWRKELERLAIKLMQRREYTRQIDMMTTSLIYHGLGNPLKFNYKGDPFEYQMNPGRMLQQKINEGKSYIVGSIPNIVNPVKMFCDRVNKHENRDMTTHFLKDDLRYIKIKIRFKIKPKHSGDKLYLTPYDINGNMEVEAYYVTPQPSAGGSGGASQPSGWGVGRAPNPASTPGAVDLLGFAGNKSLRDRGIDPTFGLHNDFKKAIDQCVDFANHLIGEIPTEAAKYVAEELGTTDAFLDIYPVKNCKTEGNIYADYHKMYCDFDMQTNFPAQLNAQMQDIIDLYKFWQKGYAEEFKRRKREEILEGMLPQVREGLKDRVSALASTYADMPRSAAESGLAIETMKIIEEEKKDVSQYIPQIKKRKDYIVSNFGQDEYKRMLAEAQGRRNNLIMQYIDNAGDVASRELLSKTLSEGMTITPQELDSITNETYKILRKKHPDTDVSKNEVRKRFLSILRVKGQKKKAVEGDKGKQVSKDTAQESNGKEVSVQQTALPFDMSNIKSFYTDLSLPAKISLFGGGAILLYTLFSGNDEQEPKTIVIKK